jgi:uncharacterized membrane protein YGL010W
VIGVREELGRLLHKRGLATAVAILVLALVLLVGVHPISDNVVEYAELVCAAAVLVLGFVVAFVGQGRSSMQRPPARSATLFQPLLVVRPALVFNDERRLPLRR